MKRQDHESAASEDVVSAISTALQVDCAERGLLVNWALVARVIPHDGEPQNALYFTSRCNNTDIVMANALMDLGGAFWEREIDAAMFDDD